MYHTKFEQNSQLDSGLGGSFGPDEETQTVEKLDQLEVSPPRTEEKQQDELQQRKIKLLGQAFTPDDDNDTYLHLFIARGYSDKAVQLVKLCPKRECLDIQNNHGQTAMHVAAYVNLHEVLSQLIYSQADIGYVDKDGKNVFHLCAERGHVESLEAIVQSACQMKQVEKVRKLLNNRDFTGLTPFFLAVSNKHVNMCKKLVELKVDVNLSDSRNGNTPLHEAVIDPGYSSLFVQFLLNDCHVNINASNYAGTTVLHCAAGREDISLFARLLISGADVNSVDFKGNTPADYGNQQIKQLVATGS